MTGLRSLMALAVGLLFPLLTWGEEHTIVAADTVAWQRDDYVKASLLIAEPSAEVYSLFGHCALRLQCPSQQMDYCFTFETSTDTKGILRFLRGDAKGGFMAAPTEDFFAAYQEAGRSVAQYELNLTPSEKLRLWKAVDDELAAGFNRHYDYLHTHCTSMIVALVQQASREPIIYNNLPEQLRGSFRHVLLTTSRYPWSTFFWQTVMGPAADATEPLEHKLVPVLLPEVWQRAGVIKDTEIPHSSFRAKRDSSFFILYSSFLLLVLCITMGQLFAGWNRLPRLLDFTLVAVHTLTAIFLSWLVLFSRLEATQWNWYLLAFNPLPQLAGVISRRWDTVCQCTLCTLLAVLLLTPFIPQLDLPHALLIGGFAVRLAARNHTTHNTYR